MASLAALPDELLVQICSYLEDTTSTKALALTCKRTTNCALERHSSMSIDLSANHAQVIHDLLESLSSMANKVEPPQIDTYDQGEDDAILRTGDDEVTKGYEFTHKAIKHASSYKALRISFPDMYRWNLPADRQLADKSIMLASRFNPETPYTARSGRERRKCCDYMLNLVALILQLARGTTTLEVQGSIDWMDHDLLDWIGHGPQEPLCWRRDMIQWDTLCSLRRLRLVALDSPKLPEVIRSQFLNLQSFSTFEFTDMKVVDETVKYFGKGYGATSITCLRLHNCHVRPSAMTTLIRGCPHLEEFEYSMGAEHWITDKTYDAAQLISDLREVGWDTLRYLSLHTLGVRVVDRCHYLEDIGQLKQLESLTVNEDHLHYSHGHLASSVCQERRWQQGHLFSEPNSISSRGNNIILSLPNSLRILHLIVWNEAILGVALPKLLRKMETEGRFPNLRDIKITVELSGACSRREFDRNVRNLLAQAAGIDDLHLKLEAVPRGTPFTISRRPWKPYTAPEMVHGRLQLPPLDRPLYEVEW
jgi:hypothetical protein